MPCPNLPNIANGQLQTIPAGIGAGNFLVGHQGVYSCNSGFSINGVKNVLQFITTCETDQLWYPDPATANCISE